MRDKAVMPRSSKDGPDQIGIFVMERTERVGALENHIIKTLIKQTPFIIIIIIVYYILRR